MVKAVAMTTLLNARMESNISISEDDKDVDEDEDEDEDEDDEDDSMVGEIVIISFTSNFLDFSSMAFSCEAIEVIIIFKLLSIHMNNHNKISNKTPCNFNKEIEEVVETCLTISSKISEGYLYLIKLA